MTIGDIDSSGTLSIDTIETKAANHVRFTNNVLVEGNLDAELDISCRKLTVTEFHPIKPYIALYVAGNAISTSTNVGFLPPSSFTVIRPSNAYTFTFTNAHPNGNNYQIFVTPRTTSTTTAFFVCTAKVEPIARQARSFQCGVAMLQMQLLTATFGFTPYLSTVNTKTLISI